MRSNEIPDPGSTWYGPPTGVFGAYMDVLMTNANLATVRYGETQELRMDVTHPGGVFAVGSFRLAFAGQQTAWIPYLASFSDDAAAIQTALEALPAVGSGNVQVTTFSEPGFEGRYFISFKGLWGEQDISGMTVQDNHLYGSCQDVNDDDGDGDGTENLFFWASPAVIDNYIPINPTTPESQAALLRSSFTFYDPYLNGRNVVDEPLEPGQPGGSRNLGEVGA